MPLESQYSFRIILTSRKIWIGYFLIKIFYMFFALFVYSKFTSLGDTNTWLSRYTDFASVFDILTVSSQMTYFLGYVSSFIFGKVFGNIPFVVLSFYGLYYSISRMELSNKQLLWLLFLLSLPSFGVWSSIAGKEAIGVFYMGIILGYIIDLSNKKRYSIRFIEVIAIYLMFVYKPQYLPAVLSVVGYIHMVHRFNFRHVGHFLLLMLNLVVGFMCIWLARDFIADVAVTIPSNFVNTDITDINSTRNNLIWAERYDIFFTAPYGVFLAFFGPTLSEVYVKPVLGVVFIESLVIFFLFFYTVVYGIIKVIKIKKINFYLFSILFISVLWLLLAHYPSGVFNPGSALRYRENFYGYLTVITYFVYLKTKRSTKNIK